MATTREPGEEFVTGGALNPAAEMDGAARHATERAEELQQGIDQAFQDEDWLGVADLAERALRSYPHWFDVATSLQAAYIELLGEKYPNNPDVRRVVQSHHLVRNLAKES